MAITIQLTDRQEQKIKKLENELGVSRKQLIEVFLDELLKESEEEFKQQARQIINNNEELNQRLAK